MYTENKAMAREMTPQEHLTQAAGRLSQVAAELSEHASSVNSMRNDLRAAEGGLARSQEEFDAAISNFRQLLEQYGLTMNVPMPEPKYR